MQIGVVFPQTEIGPDAGAVRAYGQRVEELGFRHVMAYDHVVGADPAVHQGWSGLYDLRTTFHEPMVMFGFLAALTSLELVTGHHHPAAAADRAGGQAGRRGGSAVRGPLPARRGTGLERGGVRGARAEFPHPGPADRGAGHADAPPVDRGVGDLRGRVRPGDRGRAGAAAGAEAHPGLVRCAVRARLPPGRPPRRRLVPADQPRVPNSTKPGRSSTRPPGKPAGTWPSWAWRGGSAGAVTPRSWPSRRGAGVRRALPIWQSTRWARGWPAWVIISAHWSRPLWRWVFGPAELWGGVRGVAAGSQRCPLAALATRAAVGRWLSEHRLRPLPPHVLRRHRTLAPPRAYPFACASQGAHMPHRPLTLGGPASLTRRFTP